MFAKKNLKMKNIVVAVLLFKHGPLSQKDLRENHSFKQTKVSRLINDMEKKEWIKKIKIKKNEISVDSGRGRPSPKYDLTLLGLCALAKERDKDKEIQEETIIKGKHEKYGDLLVVFKKWRLIERNEDLKIEVEKKLWKAMKNIYEIREELDNTYKKLRPKVIGFLIENLFETDRSVVLALSEEEKEDFLEAKEKSQFEKVEDWGLRIYILYKMYQGLSQDMQSTLEDYVDSEMKKEIKTACDRVKEIKSNINLSAIRKIFLKGL